MGPAPDRRQSRHGQSRRRCAQREPGLDGETPLKLFLLGRRGSINHWLEDAANAWGSDGHEVRVGVTRHPGLHPALQTALEARTAAAIARRIAAFAPDLVLSVGGFHTPLAVLQAIRDLPARPPLAGWVGDAFGGEAAPLAALYDLVAHTDSGLVARHRNLGFASATLFAPHAANPHRRIPRRPRSDRMVFIAAATPLRLQTVSDIREPISIHGPGWTKDGHHDVHARRVAHAALPGLYAGHLAALNVHNETHVVSGLNQRNFDPYLFGAPVVSDDQPDLARCFEPGREVLVYRGADDLNAAYDQLRGNPAHAAAVAAAGLRRILGEHTFSHRLKSIIRSV